MRDRHRPRDARRRAAQPASCCWRRRWPHSPSTARTTRPWTRSPAGPGSASAPCTGISRPARPCSRRSTATRSRNCARGPGPGPPRPPRRRRWRTGCAPDGVRRDQAQPDQQPDVRPGQQALRGGRCRAAPWSATQRTGCWPRAQRSGEIRPDVDATDLLRLSHALALAADCRPRTPTSRSGCCRCCSTGSVPRARRGGLVRRRPPRARRPARRVVEAPAQVGRPVLVRRAEHDRGPGGHPGRRPGSAAAGPPGRPGRPPGP